MGQPAPIPSFLSPIKPSWLKGFWYLSSRTRWTCLTKAHHQLESRNYWILFVTIVPTHVSTTKGTTVIMLWILPRRHHRIMPPLEVIRSQNESSNDPLLTTNTTNTTLQLKRAVPLASFAVHRPTRTGWVWVYVYTKSSPEKLNSRDLIKDDLDAESRSFW